MHCARACLALVLAIVACSDVFAATAYDITVRIDPATRELSGSATIVVPGSHATEIALAQRFKVASISLDGAALPASQTMHGLSIWRLEAANGERKIEVRWSGRLAALDTSINHRQTLGAA